MSAILTLTLLWATKVAEPTPSAHTIGDFSRREHSTSLYLPLHDVGPLLWSGYTSTSSGESPCVFTQRFLHVRVPQCTILNGCHGNYAQYCVPVDQVHQAYSSRMAGMASNEMDPESDDSDIEDLAGDLDHRSTASSLSRATIHTAN